MLVMKAKTPFTTFSKGSFALILGALTLSSFATVTATAAAQCSPDRIAGQCDSAALRRLDNGNPVNSKIIVTEIKERARALILARGSKDDPGTQAILARLDSLNFREAPEDDPSCQGPSNRKIAPGVRAYARNPMTTSLKPPRPHPEETPNAFYDDSSHSVVACATSLRLTPGAWASIFAHELGHVVSPCTLAKDTYQKGGAALAQEPQQTGEAMEKCLGRSATREQKEIAFYLLAETGTTTMIFPTAVLDRKTAPVVKKLEACGLLKKTADARTEIAPVFADVQRCLQHKNTEIFDKMVAKESSKKAKNTRDKNAAPHIRGFADPKKYPAQCFGATEEEFADAFGSEVFGSWLEAQRNPETRSSEALIQMRKLQCMSEGQPQHPEQGWQYPNFNTRLLAIMNSKGFRQAQNCQIDENTRCYWQPSTNEAAPETGAASSENGRN